MASITPEDVRRFIRDKPEFNSYQGRSEFSPEEIESAIDFVIDEINAVPPLEIIFDKATFPFRSVLLYGVTAHLYLGEAFRQERNHLPVNSGGVSVDDFAHSSAYTNLANNISAKFEDRIRRIKIAINMDRGWGSIRSGYPEHV